MKRNTIIEKIEQLNMELENKKDIDYLVDKLPTLTDLQSDFIYNYDVDDFNNNYIEDLITYFCDGYVDIYNYQLLKYFDGCNDYYVDEAMQNMGGIKSVDEFFNALRLAQFFEYEAELYKIINDLKEAVSEIVEEIKELENEIEELEQELEELEEE